MFTQAALTLLEMAATVINSFQLAVTVPQAAPRWTNQPNPGSWQGGAPSDSCSAMTLVGIFLQGKHSLPPL